MNTNPQHKAVERIFERIEDACDSKVGEDVYALLILTRLAYAGLAPSEKRKWRILANRLLERFEAEPNAPISSPKPKAKPKPLSVSERWLVRSRAAAAGARTRKARLEAEAAEALYASS